MSKFIRKLCSAVIAGTMLAQAAALPAITAAAEDGDETAAYAEQTSPAVTYNMNIDWKFKKPSDNFPLAAAAASVVDTNGKQFYEIGYDDSGWETVSVPHPINAEDSFDGVGVDAGEAGLYRGFMFYRKNITVPASDEGKKFILEFEAVRQSVYLYVNGNMAGYYEAGVTAMGFDITEFINAGEENLIAVATDNASDRGQSATFTAADGTSKTKVTRETIPGHEPGDGSGRSYQWNTKDFNEVQGGITGNVNLYAKSMIYQTLPLYNNLKTTGNYVYASNFNIKGGSADITVEAEIRNESGADADITLQVDVVDLDGNLVGTFSKTGAVTAASDKGIRYNTMVPSTAYDASGAGVETGTADISTVDVTKLTATANVDGLKFWSDVSPNLYNVYTYLIKDGSVIDSQRLTTGFREITYDKDKGMQVNGVTTYLKGYSQRSTNEWAAIGVANDWLEDIDTQLIKESNANYIRWMHVAPKPNEIRSGDKYGIISIVPAGDKEADVTGRSWDQRLEAMRDAIIYFRNSPSAFFYEAGNNAITAEHMRQMKELRVALDPSAGRMIGCRTIRSEDQITYAEWVGTMLARNDNDAYASMKSTGNYVPMLETEYHRNESPRRSWDDYSPEDYDYVNHWLGAGGSKKDGYDMWDQTQEDFSRTMFSESYGSGYSYFYNNRASGTGNGYYTGAAMMVWSDSNMHDRNCWAENCRTSGRVDPIRVKKESFYAIQAAQSTTPKIHILGHWNYPEYIAGDRENGNYWYEDKTWNDLYWEPNGTYLQRDPTNKTVYVIGSEGLSKIELYVNGQLKGTDKTPDNNYVYAFEGIDVTESGTVSAKAYNELGEVVAEHELHTVGEAATIRLTPVTGPDGLIADGSDLAYFDVEVIDENGDVCPLDERKISFTVSGPGVFLGGYNSGVGDRIVNHKDYVFAECGTNRVFVRSTRDTGTITLTASAEGMQPVSVSINSTELALSGGLTTQMQRAYAQGAVPQADNSSKTEAMKLLGSEFTADWDEENGNVVTVAAEKRDEYKVLVNGKEVSFAEQAYKPDENTGVVGEIGPILDAIKAAGADFTYSYTTEGEIPEFSGVYGKLPYYTISSAGNTIYLINEATDLFVNGERNLMNLMPEPNTAKTTLKAELNSVIGQIDGVTIYSDDTNKEYVITLTNTAETEQPTEAATVQPTEKPSETPADADILTYSGGSVTVTAKEALSGAKLVLAGYDSTGRLTAAAIKDVTAAAGGSASFDVSDVILAADNAIAMLWNDLDSMTPYCAPIPIKEIAAQQAAAPVLKTRALSTVLRTATAESTAQSPVGVYENDTVKMYDNCDTAHENLTLSEDISPDGTKYLKNESYEGKSGAGYPFASAGGNTTADMLWEADIRFDENGSGITPYSDGNGKLGTCVRRNDNNGASWLAVQTGSSSFTRYIEIDTTAWYHIALIGRYSAADAYTDMYVYKYNGSETEFVAKYEKVNQRNLSAGNANGADHINVHKGTSIDNVRVTALGADALTLTSDSDTLKGGGTMTFTAGATRCGLPITTPSLTWSIYNEANTAAEDDNELTLSDGNLTASLYAAAKTVNVRIDSDKLTAAKAITIDAVNVTNLPFDTLTLSAAKAYVSADEPLAINAAASKKGSAVTLGEDDLMWYVCESSGLVKLGDDLKWIKIDNGVMTVDKKAVTQDVVVVAADTSDTVRASINVHIKASDAIESGDGTIDKLVLADNCEAELANATLSAGAPDGTHYLTSAASYKTANITETASDVVFEMDMRFNGEGAGFNPGSGGKLNTCVKYHNGDICIQTGGSSYTKILTDVSTEDWYHVTIITKAGSYAHILIDKYNEDGARTNVLTLSNVNRRQDRSNAYIDINSNTSYDNVRVLAPVPNGISITTYAKTVFAGSSVTASAALSWNGLEMKDPAAGQIVYAVYDGENASPAGDSFTVSDDGAIGVSAMAPAGDYYIRAISPQAEIYDSAKLTVVSSDIFTVTKLGINEAGTEAVKLYVDKNFYYADEVTFVAAIYSVDGAMKDAAIKSVSGATLKSGEENEVSISLSLAGFDKDSDIIKVFPVTRLSTDEATETDETFKASVSGNDITITAVPAFTDKVLVLALGSGSDETDVTAADIVYIGVKNSINAEDVLKANAGAEIVKAAGIYGGAQKVFSAVLSK